MGFRKVRCECAVVGCECVSAGRSCDDSTDVVVCRQVGCCVLPMIPVFVSLSSYLHLITSFPSLSLLIPFRFFNLVLSPFYSHLRYLRLLIFLFSSSSFLSSIYVCIQFFCGTWQYRQ